MSRYGGDSASIHALIRETEVHRDVYVDEDLFKLEMERVFANAWVYVGHDSQIPNHGDFYATTIGTQPVVMVRHSDGEVHVVHNRCPHKGTKIVGESCGNVGKYFRCPYHAWTFRTDGSLIGMPLRSGYENTGVELSPAAQGLAHGRRRA